MPNWKKVIVSGSDAVLGNITASNISASDNISASSFSGPGQIILSGSSTTSAATYDVTGVFSTLKIAGNAVRAAVPLPNTNNIISLSINTGSADVGTLQTVTDNGASTTNQVDLNGGLSLNSSEAVISYDSTNSELIINSAEDEVTTVIKNNEADISSSFNADGLFTNGLINTTANFTGPNLTSNSDLTLNAVGNDIILQGAGTAFGRFKRDTSDFVIKSETSNKDIIFKGNSGGGTVTSLTLDMSNNGAAVFENSVTAKAEIVGQEFISSSGTTFANAYSTQGSQSLSIKNKTLEFGNDENFEGYNYGLANTNTQTHNFSGDVQISNAKSLQVARNIVLFGDITASSASGFGNITASGDISAGRLLIDQKSAIDTYPSTVSELTLNPEAQWGAIRLNRDGSSRPIIFYGNVTGSGSISTEGKLSASGHLFASCSENSIVSNVALYDTSTGKFFYTASNAIGGGGGSVGTLQTVTDNGSITSNPITSSANIALSASGDVIANKYEANPGGSGGYLINSTSSINTKDFGVYFANSQNWSNITVGVSTALAPSQEITLGSANVSLAGVNTAGSVNTGTNVLTIDSGTGRIHMTGSYGTAGGSNSLAFQKIQRDSSNIENAPLSNLNFTSPLTALTTGGTLPTVNIGLNINGTTDNGLLIWDNSNNKIDVESNFTFGGTTAFLNGALRVGSNAAANTTNGKIVASNDVVAFATSDERLKKYIKPIPNALDKVSQIRGIEFDWKVTDEKMRKEVHSFEGHDVGVLAQEVEKVLPEVVVTRDSGYKAVRYEKIVPLLIESIKELKAEIEELKKSK